MIQFQKDLDNFIKGKGWGYWGELSIVARLAEEVGEFAEAVNFRFGDKTLDHEKPIPDDKEELGDILYALACYANKHAIDMTKCAERSLAKVVGRYTDKQKES